MPYTQLELSNIALNMAGGRSTIRALDENSNEARNCVLIFSKTAREIISALPWDFATTVAQLARMSDGGLVPAQWLGAWARPDDAIRLVSLREAGGTTRPIFPGGIGQTSWNGSSLPFALGNLGGARCIFTNATKPILTYVKWEPDFGNWSDDAIELLTVKLASRLAIPISGDKGLRDRFAEECRVLESRFRAANANEGLDTHDVPTDWILARECNDFHMGQFSPVNIGLDRVLDLPTTPPAGSGEFWNDGGLLAVTQ